MRMRHQGYWTLNTSTQEPISVCDSLIELGEFEGLDLDYFSVPNEDDHLGGVWEV